MKKTHRKGQGKPPQKPERLCVVTRETRPRAELLRWFQAPDGQHWPDWSGRGPGEEGKARYTLPSADVVRKAAARGLLKGSAEVLVERFVQQGEQELAQRLGLATRAGRMAIGQLAVDESLRNNRVRLLLIADDASASTVSRYRQQAGRKKVPCIRFASGGCLGQPMGREFVSVAAVTDKVFASKLELLAESLEDVGDLVKA